MKKTWKTVGTLTLVGTMLFGSSLCVSAEEVTPAGYHVYDVQEREATDTWYGISRGAYLHSGISKIKEGDSAGYAVCSGHTFAHTDCDRVFVRIYLDQSATATTGTGSWGNVNYWTGEAFEAGLVSASSGSYKVDRDYYYRVQGVHSVTEGDLTETTTTCTDALYFD